MIRNFFRGLFDRVRPAERHKLVERVTPQMPAAEAHAPRRTRDPYYVTPRERAHRKKRRQMVRESRRRNR